MQIFKTKWKLMDQRRKLTKSQKVKKHGEKLLGESRFLPRCKYLSAGIGSQKRAKKLRKKTNLSDW